MTPQTTPSFDRTRTDVVVGGSGGDVGPSHVVKTAPRRHPSVNGERDKTGGGQGGFSTAGVAQHVFLVERAEFWPARCGFAPDLVVVCAGLREKRHRQQQRRARRRAARHARPSDSTAGAGFGREVTDELDEMLTGLAQIAGRDVFEPQTALEAEHWASCLLGALDVGRTIDAEIRARFRGDLVRAVDRIGSAKALATLRALSAVGDRAERRRARAAADRLAATGVPEPAWASGVGAARPGAAALQVRGSVR